MSDLYEQVSGEQDPFTKLASRLPGFGGYIERETRRSADKLLREAIADRFEQLRKRVGDLQKDLANDQQLEYLDDLEGAAMKLQTFIDKVRNAAYGNSGFFDAIKIDEAKLAQLYDYDLALMDSADEISRAIDNVETSIGEDGLEAAVGHLVDRSRDLVSAFEGRSQVIIQQDAGAGDE